MQKTVGAWRMTDEELKARLDRIEKRATNADRQSGCALISVTLILIILLFKVC